MFITELSTKIGHNIAQAYYYPRKNSFKVFYDPAVSGVYQHNERAVTVGISFDEMVLFELLIDANQPTMRVYAPMWTDKAVLDNLERIYNEYLEIVNSEEVEEPAYV